MQEPTFSVEYTGLQRLFFTRKEFIFMTEEKMTFHFNLGKVFCHNRIMTVAYCPIFCQVLSLNSVLIFFAAIW